MKNTNRRLFALFACLVLVVCALFALTSCGECTDHKYGEWEVVEAPTCTTDGKSVRTCTNDKCDAKEEEPISKLGHDLKTEETTPATCTADGVKTTTCKREGCDYSATEPIPALGHDLKTEVTTPATCTADGVKTTTCQREGCGYIAAEPIAKVDHTPDREAATCTAAKVCTVCHTVLEAKRAHVFTETPVSPTCTEGGYTKVTCENCDYENIKDRLPALGHDPDIATATCEHAQICTRCNTELEPKKSHAYTELCESRAATCDDDGYNIYKCETCALTITMTSAPALGHDVATWTETDRSLKEGTTCTYLLTYSGYCTRCGDTFRTEEKVIHTYDARVKTPATCTTAGEKTLTCTACGADGGKISYEDAGAHAWTDSQEGDYLVSHCTNECGIADRRIYNAKDKTTAEIPSGILGEADSIKMKEAELALDDEVKNLLGENTKMTADTLDDETRNGLLNTLTDEEKAKIGDSKIYNFGLESNGETISKFGENGKITVTIPYTLAEGEDPESIAIYYVNADGEIATFRATYANGYATFETNHFSYYTVARLSPSERCAVYGHSYIEADVPATCTTEGYHYALCRRCGHIERSNIVPAFGHDIASTTTPATCTADGADVYFCRNEGCTFRYTNVIPATGHRFVQDAATSKAATCTEQGHAHFVCANEGCDAEYSVTLPMADHTIVQKTTPVTCTTDGYTLNTCSVCGLSYRTGERAALGHSMTETVVPATCTEDGYTLHACRSCDYSYRTDTVAKHHTFDIEAPTCGQGQTCTVCGAKGLPATGEHTMVDGVCSVCGQGCTHDFDVVTKAASCTEGGYDEKTCKVCGKVVRENYTAKLGHDYKNGACTRCGDKLDLSNLYYQINRSLMTTKYTFLAKNVKLVIIDKNIFGDSESAFGENYAFFLTEDEEPTVEVDPDITIEISGELYFSFDEDGKLFGYLYGNLSGVVSEEPGDATAIAMIRDGKVYYKTELREPQQQTVTGVLDLVTTKEMTSGEVGGSSLIWTQIVLYLPEVLEWYDAEVLPTLLSVSDAKADEIAANTEKILSLFFRMEDRAEGGYTFTFDFDKLHAINDILAEKKVNEVVDLFFGEGTYDSITETLLPAFFEMTLGDMLDAMEAGGLPVNTVIDLLDSLLARLQIKIEGVTITSVDMILKMFGMEIGIRDMLADEDLRATNVSDVLLMLINGNFETEFTKESILAAASDFFGNLKNHTIYTFIASMTALTDGDTTPGEEEIAQIVAETAAGYKDLVDLVIETLRGYVSLSFRTDATGAVEDIELNLNAVIENIGSLVGQVSLVKDYETEIDFDDIFSDLGKIDPNPHSADGEPAIELVFDEDGTLVAIKVITKTYLAMNEDKIKNVNLGSVTYDPETGAATLPETYSIFFYADVRVATYRVKDLGMRIVEKDCGDWYAVTDCFTKVAETTFTLCEVKMTFRMSDVLELLGTDGSDPMALMDGARQVFASDLEATEEVTELDDDTAYDMIGYLPGRDRTPPLTVNYCYNEKTGAMKAASTMHDIEETCHFATEVEDCSAGLIYKSVCKTCHKLVDSYSSTGHNTNYVEETVCPKNGGCLIFSIAYHNCFCGKHGDVYINGNKEVSDEHTETLADGTVVETYLLTCGREDCTFHVNVRIDTRRVGCYVTREKSYTITENGALVKKWQFKWTETSHTAGHTTYTLKEGATSCKDGVIVSRWCDDCGWHDEDREITRHERYVSASYDLADYGSKCGGTLELMTCACGENADYNLDDRCKTYWNGEYALEKDNCSNAYSDRCKVTDCNFKILYKNFASPDTENCKVTEQEYIYLGWDGTTENPEDGILLRTWTVTVHDMETTETPRENGYMVITKTCKHCSHREIDEYWYVSDETSKTYCTRHTYEYDEKEDGMYRRTVDEYVEFTDELNEVFHGNARLYRQELFLWDGETEVYERGIEFDGDSCRFRFYEKRNGKFVSKGWESLHNYVNGYDSYFASFFELREIEAPTSCTTPGTYVLECRRCGEHVNPFLRSVFENMNDVPGGMTEDIYRETWSMVFTTIGRNGRVYVSANSYNEKDGTFRMCYGHEYVYVEDADCSYCKHCGLKNRTGGDAVAVLEDLTADADKEAGRYRAGYFVLTDRRLMPQLSLVLTVTDEEGNAVTFIVYFTGEVTNVDTGETQPMALFGDAEFDDDAYVTFDGSVVVIDWAGVMEFVEANATEELKTLLSTEGATALCRLNIVPEGGSELECAITFE